MRKTAIGLVATGIVTSLVLGACSRSSGTSSTSVRPVAAARTASTVPSPVADTVIAVAPALEANPRTPAIVAQLRRRYTDINNRNFDDYWKMYTPDYAKTLGYPAKAPEVARGYRSTVVSNIHLTQLITQRDGRLAATVTFTSNQDAADGPDNQTCTKWTVGFSFKTVSGVYLIDTPPSNYNANYDPC